MLACVRFINIVIEYCAANAPASCMSPGKEELVPGNLLRLCYAVTVFPLMVIIALYMALPLPELA